MNWKYSISEKKSVDLGSREKTANFSLLFLKNSAYQQLM